MGNVTPITEQFQHFVKNLQESFWGDWNGKAQAAMKALLEEAADSFVLWNLFKI
jgi:hypothetical protein